MAENSEDKELFQIEWDEKVTDAAAMARWQEDILGYFSEPDRGPLTNPEERQFFATFKTFLDRAAKQGKTAGEFYQAVKAKIAEEADSAIDDGERNFYTEIEAEIDPSLYDRRNRPILFSDIVLALTLRTNYRKRYKKFEDRLNRLLDMYSELDSINREIEAFRARLEELEMEYHGEEDQAEEQRLRGEISRTRRDISEMVKDRTGLLTEMNKDNKFYNDTVTEIRRLLQIERRKIEQKWGGRVSALLQSKQAEIKRLNDFNKTAPEHSEERSKITERINDCELKLQKIKEKIIKYKSKRWIFLFEKYLGHESVPGLLNERKEVTPVPYHTT